jgi:pyruvate dehydrogenase E2 component (dihydrolipoamide acetyltransferase)
MDVLMPQLGETVAEGKVTVWFKSVGDPVAPGDNLFEIETDKVSMEIQATEGGVLAEIRVPVGTVAPVGAVVATIADKAGAPAATSKPPAAAAPAAPKAAAPAPAPVAAPPKAVAPAPAPSAPVKLDPYFEVRTPAKNYGAAQANGKAITPLARRLAAEAGVDIARISGSGPRGRIVAADVKAAPVARGAGQQAVASMAAGPSAAEVMGLYRNTPFTEVPLDGMRKTIASRLQQAKQTIPHFYVVSDINMDALIRVREEINAGAGTGADGKPAYRISINDFLIKAWALALQSVPAANAVWAGDRILRFARADVAVAVAIEGGLFTPVVRSAESKSVRAISDEIRDLAGRARTRRLMPEEYQGGSSAVSNLGMYGVREFSAIINPPHGTILAVGATRRQAVEQPDGGAKFASIMTVTLSCDHRVVDGALGAELLKAFAAIVEAPLRILV